MTTNSVGIIYDEKKYSYETVLSDIEKKMEYPETKVYKNFHMDLFDVKKKCILILNLKNKNVVMHRQFKLLLLNCRFYNTKLVLLSPSEEIISAIIKLNLDYISKYNPNLITIYF